MRSISAASLLQFTLYGKSSDKSNEIVSLFYKPFRTFSVYFEDIPIKYLKGFRKNERMEN